MLIAVSLIAAVVVAAVVAGVMIFGGNSNKDVKKISVADVQTEVPKVLVDRTNGYVAGDIKDVRCNDGKDPTVKKGDTFTCTASVRGKQHQLTVTFQDDNGTYVVGLPQLDGGK
ncbi:hypothetical protein BST27_21755 [Mycobacterium intermedium]|uniref:DUF4333 domain-containing protein n=1 Tax=Mycobacterium intermedium TaxID=28445 RepID=A0A1E3S6X0_MYCIE|nr:DUF4333 domain-containing protein [Mycobacterium intermedium]MCV6967986.1 DUF4333 domain-containing protein [Mycobacterium intermedium]ODQ97888.1 hypothetical protein BHQ20_24550 [Mycobacterium intermedium]OPE48697.1 hypothetical protein BV508_16875 [Mycobacterium intermedium]ORA97786.1 hypothetical protein BST27_21755 [Mycobacterium intermedium]